MISRVLKSIAVVAAIVFVVAFDVSNAQAPAAIKPCPDGFAHIALEAARRVDLAAAEFGKTARRKFEAMLPVARQKEAEHLWEKRKIRPEVFNTIPSQFLPTDPRLAKMVIRANELLRDDRHMADFVELVASRAKKFQMQKHPEISGDTLIPASNLDFPAQLSKELGWGPMAILKSSDGGILPADQFHAAMFSEDRLLYDQVGGGISHTGSAHIWQWIMLTPLLEREFGPGAAKELWRYFRYPEAEKLWSFVFDHGPSHYSDFRAPRAFSIHRLAGPNSFFGVP